MRNPSGFTLIELLLTVTIASIILVGAVGLSRRVGKEGNEITQMTHFLLMHLEAGRDQASARSALRGVRLIKTGRQLQALARVDVVALSPYQTIAEPVRLLHDLASSANRLEVMLEIGKLSGSDVTPVRDLGAGSLDILFSGKPWGLLRAGPAGTPSEPPELEADEVLLITIRGTSQGKIQRIKIYSNGRAEV
ncbi:MAG: type II secretion system protein [Armatimonadetes bacterium]|nr:type II secretion system protein [Armatimonadota bacterium]